MKTVFALAILSALCSAGLAADIPVDLKVEYTMPSGGMNVFLVQAPANPAPEAAIIIYMHGANHDETQGMTLFPILRQLLADKGWILVSPRQYEYVGLCAELRSRYGDRTLYLAGASAGARASFEEVRKNPHTYAGLFLIGPALAMRKPSPGEVTIPTFIIYGDQDMPLTKSDRLVANELRAQKTPLKEIVIKGQGHEAPYPQQEWWYEALPFVTGVDFPRH